MALARRRARHAAAGRSTLLSNRAELFWVIGIVENARRQAETFCESLSPASSNRMSSGGMPFSRASTLVDTPSFSAAREHFPATGATSDGNSPGRRAVHRLRRTAMNHGAVARCAVKSFREDSSSAIVGLGLACDEALHHLWHRANTWSVDRRGSCEAVRT